MDALQTYLFVGMMVCAPLLLILFRPGSKAMEQLKEGLSVFPPAYAGFVMVVMLVVLTAIWPAAILGVINKYVIRRIANYERRAKVDTE